MPSSGRCTVHRCISKALNSADGWRRGTHFYGDACVRPVRGSVALEFQRLDCLCWLVCVVCFCMFVCLSISLANTQTYRDRETERVSERERKTEKQRKRQADIET